MRKLTVAACGKELSRKLGIDQGQSLVREEVPIGRFVLRVQPPAGIDDFLGRLAGKKRTATLKQISEAAADGWAGTLS
jgi:hypothetical protein